MAPSWFFISIVVFFTLMAMRYTQAADLRREWKQVFGKEGYCHLQCIQEIFAESCKGVNCTIIYDGTSEDERNACKADCVQAVTSTKMRKCLKDSYPNDDIDYMMRLSIIHYPGGCYGEKYKVEDVYGGSIVSLDLEEFLEFYDVDHY